MNFEEFTKNALRTESVVDNADVNMNEFQTLIDMFITVGTLLDYTKKGIFYNNYSKFDMDYIALVERLNEQMSELIEHGKKGRVNIKQNESLNFRLVHGLLGIMTESSEIAEHLLKHLRTGEIDSVGIIEEISDIEWYKAILSDEFDLNYDSGRKAIIRKLEMRYPDKFNVDLAAARKLDEERTILEKEIGNF